ncbi:Uncharacterised protein [Vibrio cholerae]|nr:Uncharacterised protein [Vibrio cholerae]
MQNFTHAFDQSIHIIINIKYSSQIIPLKEQLMLNILRTVYDDLFRIRTTDVLKRAVIGQNIIRNSRIINHQHLNTAAFWFILFKPELRKWCNFQRQRKF